MLNLIRLKSIGHSAIVLVTIGLYGAPLVAKDLTPDEIKARFERLEANQERLEKQLKEKDARINELETELRQVRAESKKQKAAPVEQPRPPAVQPEETRTAVTETLPPPKTVAPDQPGESTPKGMLNQAPYNPTATVQMPPEEELDTEPNPELHKSRMEMLRAHVPGSGLTVFKTKWAQMDISIYTYARYLNQLAIDDSYTIASGQTFLIDKQNNLQLGKAQIKVKGWLGSPKFRYFLYTWTSNANMGQGAQVVVGGNLNYLANKHFAVGAGIAALPTVRSTIGTFPYWLRVDARPMSDEYFRGSYTTGIYFWGDINDNWHYKTMIGNNLSQLGIDAGQLDHAFQTYSGTVWWTTDNFQAYEGIGDFDNHQEVAASLGGFYTYSRESKQNQPNTEDPENTQLRLSDGTLIFAQGSIVPGVQINDATYQMNAYNASLKYKGFSFSFDYYLRWLTNFNVTGPLPEDSFFDHGFQAQASYMIIPKLLQIYTYTSKIFGGRFGNPYEVGGGLNVYPFKTQLLRFNVDVDYVNRSPVGYLAYPLAVGAKGPIFFSNLELNL